MRAVPRVRSEHGFTLIEVMMVVMVIGILGSMAVFQIGAAREGMVADGAMRTVMAQLNRARDQAINDRRFIVVEFDVVNHRIRLVRQEVPTGTTVLSEVGFEGGVQFNLAGGVTQDTEDNFGMSDAVDFDAQTFMFSTDGTLINDSGNPVNGTIFLAIPGLDQSARAVTVLGATGRVKGYRWFGTQWTRV